MALRNLTKTLVQQLLKQSVFNPKDKTPFSVVISIASPEYCEMKAIELISEAQISVREAVGSDYHDKITQAISLLTLARFYRGLWNCEEQRKQEGQKKQEEIPGEQEGIPGEQEGIPGEQEGTKNGPVQTEKHET